MRKKMRWTHLAVELNTSFPRIKLFYIKVYVCAKSLSLFTYSLIQLKIGHYTARQIELIGRGGFRGGYGLLRKKIILWSKK